MRMKLKDGKTKVITLSYDDGVVQDIRLIEILNKYGLKGTFNIGSGLYLDESVVREQFRGNLKLSEAKKLYINSGHEVALHGLRHAFIDKLDSSEMIYEIIEDKKNIEREYGMIVRGMAYPYGVYNDLVMDILQKCHISYARTVNSTGGFGFPKNWLELHPTCHHNYNNLEELTVNFVEKNNPRGHCEMFYLWGHSYEFDRNDNWDVIENFGRLAGGHDHIWYATNIEIYDYVNAYERLQSSYDKKIVHNPSSIDVWVEIRGNVYCVGAGKTIFPQ